MFEALFQTFEEPEGGVALPARLAAFREELARRKLTGFVIPRADQQQNEYVAPSEERLAWLTGFTGSAGLAIVLRHEAAVFVDGRYTLQAGKQVDTKVWSVAPLVDPPPESWLASHLKPGDRLGFDPWLHTSAAAERLAAACTKAGAELVVVDSNPLDSVWTERPQPPLGPVAIHGAAFSGEAETEKLGRIRLELANLGADALVLSNSHAVAWTFNIRGADVSHTPLPLSYALVPKDGRPTIFIDHRKLSNSARDHLERSADVREPDALAPALTELAQRGASIALDSATAADALSRLIGAAGGKAVRGNDPVALLKAVKNATEIDGTRKAHRRDAAALARFLAWIDREAPSGALTEIDAVEKLRWFRRRTAAKDGCGTEGRVVRDDLGTGPNGAIVHYRVTREHTNRRISAGDLYLIDFGAQYRMAPPMSPGRSRSAHRRRKCATASPACCRAISPSRTRVFPSAPPARSSTASPVNSCGRRASISTRHRRRRWGVPSVHEGPARISRLGHHAAPPGHDPFRRARLLQARRLWDPDRESALVVPAPDDRRRRRNHARLRDAVVRADRSPADRRRDAEQRPNSPGSTTITPASAARCARMSTRPECGPTPPLRRLHAQG